MCVGVGGEFHAWKQRIKKGRKDWQARVEKREAFAGGMNGLDLWVCFRGSQGLRTSTTGLVLLDLAL